MCHIYQNIQFSKWWLYFPKGFRFFETWMQYFTLHSFFPHLNETSPVLSFSQLCGHGPDCCPRGDWRCPQSERAARRRLEIWTKPTRSIMLVTARLCHRRTTSSPSATWPTPLFPAGMFPRTVSTHSSRTLRSTSWGHRGLNTTRKRRHVLLMRSRQRGKN